MKTPLQSWEEIKDLYLADDVGKPKQMRETSNVYPLWDNVLNVEQALKDKEKTDKALEIINKKNVLINWLKRSDSLEMYNQMCYEEIIPLTQEEFDLLKEVLKHE